MNCQNEPGYPLLTVVFCLNAPYLTAHLPTNRCGLQAPHSTETCGEWIQMQPTAQEGKHVSRRDAIEYWSGYAITAVTVALLAGYCWMEMTK